MIICPFVGIYNMYVCLALFMCGLYTYFRISIMHVCLYVKHLDIYLKQTITAILVFMWT